MIFYIHGFNSSASNNLAKSIELESIFQDSTVATLDYDSGKTADEIIERLATDAETHIRRSDHQDIPELFIGTSLGGFFADILAEKLGGNAALFNPCFAPSKMLAQFVGENTNYGTGKRYIFTDKALASYQNHERRYSSPKAVFVAKEDEQLNANEMIEHYEGHARIVTIEGGHRIASFAPYASELVALYNSVILVGLND